jgi:hypothetical protein
MSCVGCLIVYYNIFSGIMSSLFLNLIGDENSIFVNDKFHLLWYAFLNLIIIFKRTIKDLNIVGSLHYIAAKLFIVTLAIKFIL